MVSLSQGNPRDRRGRIVKLGLPGVEAWRRLPAFQDSDEEDGGKQGTPIASRRRGNEGRPNDGEVISVRVGEADEGNDDFEDDDGDDDDSDLGQPLGSTTPTLTSSHSNPPSRARSRQELPMMSSGGTVGPTDTAERSQGWRRRRGEEEYDDDEEEDYGRPVPRTITASPPMLPSTFNRV